MGVGHGLQVFVNYIHGNDCATCYILRDERVYTCVEMVNTSASSSLYCRVLYIVPYLVRSVRAFEVMCIRVFLFHWRYQVLPILPVTNRGNI